MTHRRSIVVALGWMVVLTACGEPSQTPAGAGSGEKVTPTEARPGESEPCDTWTPQGGKPVSAEEAKALGIDSVGGELDDVETVADTRQVCNESYDVWVVTGTLANGDATETYVTRDTGQVIFVSISGGSD